MATSTALLPTLSYLINNAYVHLIHHFPLQCKAMYNTSITHLQVFYTLNTVTDNDADGAIGSSRSASCYASEVWLCDRMLQQQTSYFIKWKIKIQIMESLCVLSFSFSKMSIF